MNKRIALALWSFVSTAILSATFVSTWAHGFSGVPQAIEPAYAAIGVGVGTLAAFLAWRRSGPVDSGTVSEPPALSNLERSLRSEESESVGRWKDLAQFGILLFLGMGLTSAWVDPHNGGLRLTPSIANFVPGLLIASFASALMKRDARRKRGEPDRWQVDGFEAAAGRIARKAASKTGNAAAGGLGAGIAAGATGARGFGRMFRTFRSGGSLALGQPDWIMLVSLFAIGSLFFAIGIARDAGPAILIAGFAFGGAAALSYDHDLSRVFRLSRLPELRDLALLALCVVPILWLVVVIEMAAAPASIDHPTHLTIGLTIAGKVLAAIGQLLVAAPLLSALVSPAPGPGEKRPLWPLLAGFVGGEVALLVLMMQWNAATTPAFEFYGAALDRGWRENAASAVAFPPLGLLLGAGVAACYQALTAHRRNAFDWDRLFPASIKGCMALMAVATLGCIITQNAPTQSWRIGQAEAGMVTGLVWLYVLWRIDAMRPASGFRVLVGWIAITVLFYASALAAYMTGAGNDWAGLLLIFTLPIAILSWILTVTIVPGLMRRVLG